MFTVKKIKGGGGRRKEGKIKIYKNNFSKRIGWDEET